MKQLCVITYFIDDLSSLSVIYRRPCSQYDRASVLSARPPKPEKLLYSTLHLQTDSSFTGPACRKWDWVSFFLRRCLSCARLGCEVTLPGENSITAGVKYAQRQVCFRVVSVVNFRRLEDKTGYWLQNKTPTNIPVSRMNFFKTASSCIKFEMCKHIIFIMIYGE